MRFVIYGAGYFLKKYLEQVRWEYVAGVIDSDIEKHGTQMNGISISAPHSINDLKYDFVVVFTDVYFYEIKDFLVGELGVDERMIVSYTIFLPNYSLWSEKARDITKRFIREAEGVILDTDAIGYSRYRLNLNEKNNIMNLVDPKYKYMESFYSPGKIAACDGLLLWGNYEETVSRQEIAGYRATKILWTIPHRYVLSENFNSQLLWLTTMYESSQFVFLNETVYIFEKKKTEIELDCKIYQVSHKKYNCPQNDMYKVIHVGTEDFKADFYDNTGENISWLNDRINECTAIFWIWKNTRSKFVGINHYRRHFFNDGIKERANILSKKAIEENLDDEGSIIIPELTRLNRTILENIKRAASESACMNALVAVRQILGRKQPDYLESFESVLQGNVMYRCNMFVAPWRIFDSYCKWLFSFLIDLAEMVDVSEYDPKPKRVVGYFAEIMLTVWLNHQNIKTVEFPITDI